MSTTAIEISYYLKIAVDINKRIGGTKGYQCQAEGKDKFAVQKDAVDKDLYWVKMSLMERGKKNQGDVVSITAAIKERMQNVGNQIERMRVSVNNDKQCNETSRSIKLQIIDQLNEKAKALNEIIDGSTNASALSTTHPLQTYTDSRALLLDSDPTARTIYSPDRQKNRNGPSQIQLEAIKRFDERNAQQDIQLGQLVQMTKEWKIKMRQMGELIEVSDKKIGELSNQVEKVNDDLTWSNKKLKGIIEQYSKPHKVCIDVVLIVLLIGVLVGIIKVANS